MTIAPNSIEFTFELLDVGKWHGLRCENPLRCKLASWLNVGIAAVDCFANEHPDRRASFFGALGQPLIPLVVDEHLESLI